MIERTLLPDAKDLIRYKGSVIEDTYKKSLEIIEMIAIPHQKEVEKSDERKLGLKGSQTSI